MHISLTLPYDEFKSWQQNVGKKPQVSFIGMPHARSLECMPLNFGTKQFMYFCNCILLMLQFYYALMNE